MAWPSPGVANSGVASVNAIYIERDPKAGPAASNQFCGFLKQGYPQSSSIYRWGFHGFSFLHQAFWRYPSLMGHPHRPRPGHPGGVQLDLQRAALGR